MKLNEMGEDEVVARLIKSLGVDNRVLLRAGDDCAVVRYAGNLQLLKTDCIVEGVHFIMEANPKDVGWKGLCRPISDIAAMGGKPLDALVTVALPGDLEFDWLRRLYVGLKKAASEYGVNLVGGETAKSPGPVFISVSLTGTVSNGKYVTRGGGQDGDWLFVTGRLGGSIKGKHLRFRPRVEQANWLVEHHPIHAMMDLSDGLASDLPRMAVASGLDFDIDLKKIPRSPSCAVKNALYDGEDYELLFAFPDSARIRLEKQWKETFPNLRLTAIGRLVQQGQCSFPSKGYDHFG
jgi:thiamine-monophosphate kinase